MQASSGHFQTATFAGACAGRRHLGRHSAHCACRGAEAAIQRRTGMGVRQRADHCPKSVCDRLFCQSGGRRLAPSGRQPCQLQSPGETINTTDRD